MCLYRIRYDLYEPQTRIKIICYLVYDIESLFSTPYQKEDEKMKPFVTTVISYTWYVWSLGYCTSSNLPMIHFTYMYAPIGRYIQLMD
jgi:hypothetical protein